MGTLITGPAYGGSTDYFDGDSYDAGDYDSTDELMDDVEESMAEDWADDVSNPEHLIDATGGDLTEEETDALSDIYGDGSTDGPSVTDSNSSSDGGSGGPTGGESSGSMPSMPSVPQVIPVPTGSGSSPIGPTGILLAGAAVVAAVVLGGD